MKQETYQNGGVSGVTLKWLAMLTMLIDHVASGFLYDYNFIVPHNLLNLYDIMRLIGRLAFPIFAFLIVQGYQHTSNLERYLRNLFVFALISEIPFDLAFNDQFLYLEHQNIFFTLLAGVVAIASFEHLHKKYNVVTQMLPYFGLALLAELFFFDYGFYGVTFIFGLGILRNKKIPQTIFGVLMGLLQNTASLAFIPIWFYNGKRGKQNKWFFYLFYPLHILLIYALRVLLI